MLLRRSLTKVNSARRVVNNQLLESGFDEKKKLKQESNARAKKMRRKVKKQKMSAKQRAAAN